MSKVVTHGLPTILRQVRQIQNPLKPSKYYAVAVGRRIGIYESWGACRVETAGYVNAKYQRFNNYDDALQYMREVRKEVPVAVEQSDDSMKVVNKEMREQTVYTDGSCWRNGMEGARAAVGIHWPSAPEHDLSALIDGKQTSIRAELQAAILALRQAKQLGVQHLTVYTDSDFVIKCATSFLHTWRRNGYRTSTGAEVKNPEDMKELDLAIQTLKKVTWVHVCSHTGVAGNEQADKLANSAIAKHMKENEDQLGADQETNQQNSTPLDTQSTPL